MQIILSLEEVAASTGVHTKTLIRWAKEKKFPSPVNHVGRIPARLGVHFYGDEIDKWILDQAVDRAVAEAQGNTRRGRPRGAKSFNPSPRLAASRAIVDSLSPAETDARLS